MTVKIELGPGHSPLPGYSHYVDVIPAKHITNVLDFAQHGLNPPKGFKNNVADEICAIHFLEHLPRNKQEFFFNQCKRVLKPGGWLKVHVPNFDSIVKFYTQWKNNTHIDKLYDSLQVALFGSGEGHFEKHRIAYNWQLLEHMFSKCGYRNVQNLTNIERDRHTEGWMWACNEVRAKGIGCADFSLIVKGQK